MKFARSIKHLSHFSLILRHFSINLSQNRSLPETIWSWSFLIDYWSFVINFWSALNWWLMSSSPLPLLKRLFPDHWLSIIINRKNCLKIQISYKIHCLPILKYGKKDASISVSSSVCNGESGPVFWMLPITNFCERSCTKWCSIYLLQTNFWMRRILSIKSAFQSHHRFLFQKQIKEYSIGNVKVWHLTYMVNKMVNCRGMKHGVKVVGATNTMGRCQVNKYSNVHHARYQTLPVILWCRKNVCFLSLWGTYLVDCSALFIAQHCLFHFAFLSWELTGDHNGTFHINAYLLGFHNLWILW